MGLVMDNLISQFEKYENTKRQFACSEDIAPIKEPIYYIEDIACHNDKNKDSLILLLGSKSVSNKLLLDKIDEVIKTNSPAAVKAFDGINTYDVSEVFVDGVDKFKRHVIFQIFKTDNNNDFKELFPNYKFINDITEEEREPISVQIIEEFELLDDIEHEDVILDRKICHFVLDEIPFKDMTPLDIELDAKYVAMFDCGYLYGPIKNEKNIPGNDINYCPKCGGKATFKE